MAIAKKIVATAPTDKQTVVLLLIFHPFPSYARGQGRPARIDFTLQMQDSRIQNTRRSNIRGGEGTSNPDPAPFTTRLAFFL